MIPVVCALSMSVETLSAMHNFKDYKYRTDKSWHLLFTIMCNMKSNQTQPLYFISKISGRNAFYDRKNIHRRHLFCLPSTDHVPVCVVVIKHKEINGDILNQNSVLAS